MTAMIKLIVRDYLSSLKERDELDYIFPLLLDQMNFKVLKSAASSKGQSEHGNDIAAIKQGSNGERKIYIFQIKAGDDKDIDSNNFNKKDGIRESLLQAKDYSFKDYSIPEINSLDKKIVLVHNGELKYNFRTTFNGFITKNFDNMNESFERWDIFKLTEYFSKYLLNEYLFTDIKLLNLFKKSLAFIDIPENDFRHFRLLVEEILKSNPTYSPKAIRKIISTFSMISVMILHYSRESNNLHPAKYCLTFMLLKTWAWIIEKKAINKRQLALKEFSKLFILHSTMMEEYFSKTIKCALMLDGLFSNSGGHFEQIGYPNRSMEYISYLIYHCYSTILLTDRTKKKEILSHYASLIQTLISKNSGCSRPLLDNHSIPIVLIMLFFIECKRSDLAAKYLIEVINNIELVKTMSNRLPEFCNNLEALIEFCATGERPASYIDNASYLIKTLLEFAVLFNNQDIFNECWEYLAKDIVLETYYPKEDIITQEHLIFSKELQEEGYTEVFNDIIDLNANKKNRINNYELFRDGIKYIQIPDYLTDRFGMKPLRILAHIFFKTPIFPSEWRQLIKPNS